MNVDGDNVKVDPKELNPGSLEERRKSHESYKN
jgi:hypothetical protein